MHAKSAIAAEGVHGLAPLGNAVANQSEPAIPMVCALPAGARASTSCFRAAVPAVRRVNAPDWGLAAQPVPDFDADQRVNWRMVEAAIKQFLQLRLREATVVSRPEPMPYFDEVEFPCPSRDATIQSSSRPPPSLPLPPLISCSSALRWHSTQLSNWRMPSSTCSRRMLACVCSWQP